MESKNLSESRNGRNCAGPGYERDTAAAVQADAEDLCHALVITPDTMCAVRDAIADADTPTVKKHGHFLGPIADRILAGATASERAKIQAALGDSYRSLLAQASSCK